MTSIVSVSLAELNHRRTTLRHRRRRQIVHSIWRMLAVSSLAGGLVWGATRPALMIRQPEQIAIEGNRLLSDRAIRSQLSLTYPQSLLRIEPQAIAQELTSPQSPIAKATVTRQLFPPSLIVQVQERQPVAIALSPNAPVLQASADQLQAPSSEPSPVGLIDEKGSLIPLERYKTLNASIPSLNLKVTGFQQQYLPQWVQLYQAVRSSPVKIFEIDLQDPGNAVLKSELGIIHLGPLGPQVSQQIEVLASLRQLPDNLKSSQIAYIDLRTPNSPAIQMLATQLPTKPQPHLKTPGVRNKRT